MHPGESAALPAVYLNQSKYLSLCSLNHCVHMNLL